MISYVVPLLFCVCFVYSGPHSQKLISTSKETVEDVHIPRGSNHFKDGKHDYSFDHESILGSHDLADEFDSLPPEEAKKRLRSLAELMDKNGDKFVDKVELTNWVLFSFKKLTEEEALEELEDEDTDEDGKITWEEHAAETFGIYDDDAIGSKDSEEELQMLANDKELFVAADLNKDGILDKSEYPAFSHPEEFEHMHEIVYKQAMMKRDVNKDGVLSFEEFISSGRGTSLAPNSEHYLVEKDRFENDFDVDGDKMLNKEEVLLWLIPNNLETAESEADHLIESSDTDKDGKLSIDEIVDHHDVFVGSEATDFGEQLHNTHRYVDEL